MKEKFTSNPCGRNPSVLPTSRSYVLKRKEGNLAYKINYEDELNPSQFDAARQKDGPVLVIAGAGSGKTRTLVYRVARLIEDGVNPESILLLTFTRKAANEMLNRASSILDERCSKVSGGTFHSFANLVLRKYSNALELKNSFTILDRGDCEDVINLIRSNIIKTKDKRYPKKSTILDIYSKSVNKLQTADAVIEKDYPNFEFCIGEISQICREYIDYKREHSLLDYDDLLLYFKILLENNEHIRKQLSQKYKYIMIDEYQDTNAIQADIVRLLASEHNNVMAVGDDSQSIYSFRGADFKNIMNFPNLFENTKIIKLEQNYRSTQKILDLSNKILAEANEKYEKNLFSEKTTGELPAIVACPNLQTEAEFITQRVLELYEEYGVPLSEIAVLTRSARNTYQLEIELNKKKIPFKKFGGFKFIETAHIKDIIAHLRILQNRLDKISWHRVLLLLDGIGDSTVNKILPQVTENFSVKLLEDKSILKSVKIKSGIENLFETIKKAESLHLVEMVNLFIEYYRPILISKYDDYPKRERDLEQFLYLSENYKNLEKFLTDLALEPPDASFSGVEKTSIPDDFLTVSTIHSAKGLEWNSVFIIGAVEGKFPSIFTYDDENEMEEERRLMYVSVTRAKENLYITYPIDMFDYSTGMVLSKPSRFVSDIGSKILERWHLDIYN